MIIKIEKNTISTYTLAIKAGILTCIGFIVFFMFMKYMNLIHIMELRALNIFILFSGIYFAFKHFKRVTQKQITYLEGYILGCSITAISVISFALFSFVYFQFIDPGLIQNLKGNSPLLGIYITPAKIVITLIIEGLISGMILSFSFVQYIQKDSSHV
jgi:hypothetical protein